MAEVRLRKVVKAYGKETVIDGLDLDIPDGSFTVLVGPSGCGKSTTLRMIAGLETISGGEVWIGGRKVNALPPGRRDVAMVFQNYALYPTMNVFQNIAFGLRNRGDSRKAAKQAVEEIAETVGLGPFLYRKPSQLSGGQRQRVALARAMVKKPQVFLMDEPLSNLDAKLRNQMRVELSELHKQLGTTFIYVTHDQVEAMTMGDRIVVMDQGEIQQAAAPMDLYRDPANRFVARFIGAPAMNIVTDGAAREIGFRPEKARMALNTETAIHPGWSGEGIIVSREILGSEALYYLLVGTERIVVKQQTTEALWEAGQRVAVHVETADLYAFDPDTGVRQQTAQQPLWTSLQPEEAGVL